MATEQDTSTPEATLRPQTPAARARNPEANRERTAEERERLRAESRARRKARADGKVVAPEPPADEIIAQTPVGRRARNVRAAGANSAAQRRPRRPPQPHPAATPPPPPAETASPRRDDGAPARHAGRRPRRPSPLRRPCARLAAAAVELPATTRPAQAPPSRRPPVRPTLPTLPSAPRERAAILLGIASAIGIVIALATSIGSGSLPGFGGGGLRAQATAHVVAPGGWLTLSGEHAPGDTKLLLESRGRGEQLALVRRGLLRRRRRLRRQGPRARAARPRPGARPRPRRRHHDPHRDRRQAAAARRGRRHQPRRRPRRPPGRASGAR